jgi:carbonic anhydrase
MCLYNKLHFVSYNHELYKSPAEAATSNDRDGLLVMATFVKLGQFNPEFDKLAKMFRDIHLKDQFVYIGQIIMRNLLSSIFSSFN